MTNQELNQELELFCEHIEEFELSGPTRLSAFWAFFERTFKDTTQVHADQILIFDNYCPDFSKSIRCYGITKEISIQNAYAEARKPYFSTICKIEDGHPDVLYIRIPPYSKFVPFGKHEESPDDQFFMNAILSDAKSDDELYRRFKAYISRCFTHIEQDSYGTIHHYIEEDTILFLETNYPNLMERFDKEQRDYLKALGYIDARIKFEQLQKAEETSLSLLSKEDFEKIIEIRVGDKYIPVIYS